MDFGAHFWTVQATIGAPLALKELKNTWFDRLKVRRILQRDEISEKRVPLIPMGRKFENFEIFYFLVFRFV